MSLGKRHSSSSCCCRCHSVKVQRIQLLGVGGGISSEHRKFYAKKSALPTESPLSSSTGIMHSKCSSRLPSTYQTEPILVCLEDSEPQENVGERLQTFVTETGETYRGLPTAGSVQEEVEVISSFPQRIPSTSVPELINLSDDEVEEEAQIVAENSVKPKKLEKSSQTTPIPVCTETDDSSDEKVLVKKIPGKPENEDLKRYFLLACLSSVSR